MFQERCYDRENDINNNFYANDMTNNIDIDATSNDFNNDSMNMNNFQGMMGDCPRPLVEPMQERCVHRTIMHEVPHVCPIRTRIINHHIYKHTYRPEYSCCEENVVSNINQGSCCNFR